MRKGGSSRKRKAAHLAEYEGAKARAVVHEKTLNEIQVLEERLAEINEAADAKRQALAKLGDPDADFKSLQKEWNANHSSRADLLDRECRRLSTLSKSKLRATLRRAGDILPLAEKLKQILKGTKTRGEYVDTLIGRISTSDQPLKIWLDILDELFALAWLRIEDEAGVSLPSTPRLDGAGFTPNVKLAIARQFEPAHWLDLLLFDIKDLPVFEYQVRSDDYLPFEKVSPGQQATALLSILLMQEGPPLLIDQPEDDLNMKIINDIVETLWQAKTHRQILFASHNANLVVNGDAELVICCDYRTSGTESSGQIKMMGAIDVPEINREITEVMEGGEAAFILRRDKYGF